MHERTIVFLHGIFGSPFDFQSVEGFVEEEARCLAPPIPIPRSDAPDIGDLVDFVRDVLEDAGIEDALFVGSSFGGALALAFARRHPERVRGLVLSGLVALDPIAEGLRAPAGVPILLLAPAGPPDEAFARRAALHLRGSRLFFIGEGSDAPFLSRPALFAFHLRAFLNDVYPRAITDEDEEPRLALMSR